MYDTSFCQGVVPMAKSYLHFVLNKLSCALLRNFLPLAAASTWLYLFVRHSPLPSCFTFCPPAWDGFSHPGFLFLSLRCRLQVFYHFLFSNLSWCFPGVCSLLGPQWILCPVCGWPHPPHSRILRHLRKTGRGTGHPAQVSRECPQRWVAWFWWHLEHVKFGTCRLHSRQAPALTFSQCLQVLFIVWSVALSLSIR